MYGTIWIKTQESEHINMNILAYDDEELHRRGRERVRESVRLHDFDDEEDED
jgi:hypothetical protein